jgi:hemolysin activation/secretion protein
MPHPVINRKTAVFGRLCLPAVLPLLGVLALCGAAISPAFAVEIPPSAQPGQVGKKVAPLAKPSDQLRLNVPAPVESQKIPDKLRAQLESNKFALKSVLLDGATAYTSADLAFAYQDQIGHTISLLDARAIAAKITSFYRNNGYILTQAVVPAQDISKGVLKIRVVEGFIGNVTLEGDVSNERERARLNSYGDSIKSIHPAKMEDLERYMLLMNDLPGQTITGLIRPSTSGFASADLVLTVRRRTFEGSYTFDNRGSKYLGPFQHTWMMGANSIINSYDHTQVRVMTANPFKELFLIELQHDEILDTEGTKLTMLASHTRTQPGDTLKELHVVGDSDLFEAKISHPFLRLRQQSVVARAVLDFRNTGIDVFSRTPLTRDRLRIARLGTTYSFLDSLQGSDSIDVQLSQGMNIFEATDKGTNRSNPIGDSEFTKANFDMSRLQPLENNISLLTSATGQFAFQPLLTDEQFSFGGADYGRAFDPGEGLGDSGLGGKAELRYDGLVEQPYFDSYQLFTFFDIGEAWVRGTAPGSKAGSKSMSSVGLGSRFKFTENFSGSFEADFPVIKPINDPTNYRHNPRLFFSVTARF